MDCLSLLDLQQLDPEAASDALRNAHMNHRVANLVAFLLRQLVLLSQQIEPVLVVQHIRISGWVVVLWYLAYLLPIANRQSEMSSTKLL